jgi:ABC-type polysaccharide/polyol phosphate export permease
VRALYLLARLRLKEIIYSPATAALYLGLPVALGAMVAVVFAGGHPFERRTVDAVGCDAAPLARFDGLRLRSDASLEAALARLDTRQVSAVLAPGRVIVGPREELFGRGLAAALPAPATVELRPLSRWGYVHYLFPGLLAIAVFAGGLFGMGYSMAHYRSNQFLKKMATTPVGRVTFVAAQVGSRAVLVGGQLALLLVAGVALFGLPLDALGAALALALALLGLLAFLGIGFALACAITNEQALLDAINLVIMPAIFLSEIFFSVEELPAPLARVAAALPSTALVRLLRGAMLYGERDARALAPNLALLAGWTALTFLLAVRAFRWHRR